ncbi:outer membrane receptor for ferric coprogen and ferric-rhodotorulic acid [Larkinella arboricola]|uniref:Outer membrane receptor for ferric coprogen and ferric-rhodotorulic acid n=1 Tax=Larkinella arboricola TaxID=643671 RepID=A0A327WXX3_LARAB|nr:TonB-dependent receptor [Larkinella arboricola]RAJ97656.1 outer membrane receptor for ferric coprogen and ferric-rhodotorulic acid [Larkinella arboricola]
MKFLYLLLTTVWVVMAPCRLLGQHQSGVQGTVFDARTKEPLAGVSVSSEDRTTGTITDASGKFSFTSITTNVLISAVGYQPQTVKLAEKPLSIALEPTVENLQTIVVTASREARKRTEAPVAISRLSPTLIDETKPTLLAELINKTPGVVMLNYNNEQHGMGIRQPFGTTAYFLYLEDGLPLRPMGVFNHNALIEMNVFAVSSVEVVKGPASSLYGPEAVGGAINLITQRPTAVPTFRIGVQGDQWNYGRIQYGAGGMLTKKLGIYAGGFFARQRNSWQTRSDYDKTSFNARAEYAFTSRTRLTGTFAYNDYDSQTGGSVDSIAFYNREYTSTSDFTYRNVKATRARLTLDHQWKNGADSYVTAFYRANSIGQNPSYGIRWTSGSTKATGQINVNAFTSYGLIAQHSQRIPFWNSRLLAGLMVDASPTSYNAYQIDLEAQLRPDKKSVERYTLVQERPDLQLANYAADLLNSAVYAQLDLNPLPPLRLSLGGRFDQMTFDYDNYLDQSSGRKAYRQFTPKVGVTYDLGQDRGLYGNYSRGFSPPGLTAVFTRRANVQPGEPLFYYNLQPAYFNNYEIGGWASLLNRKIYLDVALYQMEGRNELLNIRQPDNSTDYQSAGKTLHRGIEYSLTYRPTREWFFRFGGTNALHRFVHFALSTRASDAVKNVNGFDMPQAPRWVANTELTYKPRWAKGLRLSAEWQRISSWYQNQINTVSYNDRGAFGGRGISVINLRAGYPFRRFEVFANLLNATNELYATSATRGNNPTDRTTYTPAAPRTLVGGIQYNFSK